MSAKKIIYIFILMTHRSRASVTSDITINDLVEYETICIDKPCIIKCCPDGQYMGFMGACTSNNDTNIEPFLDFNEVVVYDKNIEATKKQLRDVFHLVPSEVVDFDREIAFDCSFLYNNYLIEDGSLMQELPNTYDRWTPLTKASYCMDYALSNGVNVFKTEPRFWTIREFQPEEDDLVIEFIASALLISSVFLALVLIVYCLLPELRNLGGLILMAYVASHLGAFLMLATLQIITAVNCHTVNVCRKFTFCIYYCFISSFCWTNVMSFDIWWTFRGYAKSRPIHRRGEGFKFRVYCIYAWGLPGIMTAILGALDQADLRHIPWFIAPNLTMTGCFFEGASQFVYLYVPMLAMIVVNWLFFVMTGFNIWRLSRGTAVLDSAAAGSPSAHRSHRQRFMVYLKLSVIMGVSWVLEVVSFLLPKYRVWYLSDAYNLLIGVSIFLIFVCKKKIFLKLGKRLSCTRLQWSPNSNSRSNSCSSDSDASQDTTSQLICSNPTGTTYSLKR